MKTPVAILGYNQVGRRLAGALQRQPDFGVAKVCDPDPYRLAAAAAGGWRTQHSTEPEAGEPASWWVDCRSWEKPGEGILIFPAGGAGGPPPVDFSLLTSTINGSPRRIRVLPATTLAYARLFRALSPMGLLHRCQATVVAPPDPLQPGGWDALQPVFDRADEVAELKQALASAVGEFHLCRVAAPYSRSQLHLVSLEFESEVREPDVRQALRAATRIVLGAAGAGFAGTAPVQEFCRDGDRLDGARPELFLWSESVVVQGRRVHLIMDVDPEGTPIPEIIDALRWSTQPGLALAESIALTDQALGLKSDFDWVATKYDRPSNRGAHHGLPDRGLTATRP